MIIAAVLEKKGNAVATIADSAPVKDVISTLARENFGALVVLDATGALTGIVSERDVVRHLSTDGGTMLTSPVSDVMTANPLTCTRDGAIADVLQMMVGWNIRHLPVMENGILYGLVSLGDLVGRSIENGVFDAVPPHWIIRSKSTDSGGF